MAAPTSCRDLERTHELEPQRSPSSVAVASRRLLRSRASRPSLPAPPVEVARVEGQRVVERIQATGDLIPREEATVASEVQGLVTKLHVDEGERGRARRSAARDRSRAPAPRARRAARARRGGRGGARRPEAPDRARARAVAEEDRLRRAARSGRARAAPRQVARERRARRARPGRARAARRDRGRALRRAGREALRQRGRVRGARARRSSSWSRSIRSRSRST